MLGRWLLVHFKVSQFLDIPTLSVSEQLLDGKINIYPTGYAYYVTDGTCNTGQYMTHIWLPCKMRLKIKICNFYVMGFYVIKKNSTISKELISPPPSASAANMRR